MSESPGQRLDERIAALIDRIRLLAAERDELLRERGTMRERLAHGDTENGRLRTVLQETAAALRQE